MLMKKQASWCQISVTTNCLPNKELETSHWIKTLSAFPAKKPSALGQEISNTEMRTEHVTHTGPCRAQWPSGFHVSTATGHTGQKHSTFNKIHFYPAFCISTHFSLLEIPLSYQAYSDLFLSAWNSPFVNSSSGFPGGTVIKNPPANAGDARDVDLIPGSERSPGVGNGNPLQFLPGECHGQRSLVGYSPWGRKEWDVTEHTHRHAILPQEKITFKAQPGCHIFPWKCLSLGLHGPRICYLHIYSRP